MKKLGLALAVCACVPAFASYSYYFTQNFYPEGSFSSWVFNGTYTSIFPLMNFGSSASGALVSNIAVGGANANDYEVDTTLPLAASGGVYMQLLRASSGAAPGLGSYVSVELQNPTFASNGVCSATLAINQVTNGSATQLASSAVNCLSQMQVKSVIFGTNLWVFLNGEIAAQQTVTATSGMPAIGGYSMPSSNGFASVQLGIRVTTAPNAVDPTTLKSSVFPTSASVQWAGAADPNGPGTAWYQVYKSGTLIATTEGAEFTDATLTAGNTYSYSIVAEDFHGNASGATSLTVVTPPAGAIDPRRTGVRPTGSYWGGGGEQIDMMSGNVNFSLPLVKPQLRSGATVPIGISYNSQNWSLDGGGTWQDGADVGYGFGWRMAIGSVTPYWTGNYTIDHYVFTDATGASYRLNQKNGTVWNSDEGIYVYFDSSSGRLYFRDGTFWVMGCVSGGQEADAGTLYPTTIEDVHGNQIVVNYAAGAGLLTSNTSARISSVYDMRSNSTYTYTFQYNSDSPVPHLTGVISNILTPESFTFTYATHSFNPPFGTNSAYAGQTVTLLSSMAVPATGNSYAFTYDSAGAGELTQVTFPFGGYLAWAYTTFTYSGSRELREVSTRQLAASATSSPVWTYPFTHNDSSNPNATIHNTTLLADASGVGAKNWTFITQNTGSPWQVGLLAELDHLSNAAGSQTYEKDLFTWAQDNAGHTDPGNPYITIKTVVTDPGQSYQQSALSTQTEDPYGNVLTSAQYDYNNTTTPRRTYMNTYLSSSAYAARYVFNRLLTSVLNVGGVNKTLVTNFYDNAQRTGSVSNPCYSPGASPTVSGATVLLDASIPKTYASRGLATGSTTLAGSTCSAYFDTGNLQTASDTSGHTVTITTTSSTNYTAPQTITTQSYNETIGYNAWLGITQTTGANGEQLSLTYDSYGRPATATSPYSTNGQANTVYGYPSTNLQTKTGPDGFTQTTLDGVGHSVLVQRGTSSGNLISATQTVYAPCACSPLAKIQKVSEPYANNSSPSAWTSYTYDGLGRTLTTTRPDGVSTTTYAYAGNQTTIADPAGKWKTFTNDVLGNLTSVVEPDPANQPGGTLTTTYTYDWMNHVSGVSMTRGSTTQTRTFVYNDLGLLTSATNPENGTVTYSYNGDNTLAYKVDAKSQKTAYTYDSEKRVTMVQHYGSNGYEDACQRVTYTYDTNLVDATFSQYTTGRLTTVQYGNGCSSWGTAAQNYFGAPTGSQSTSYTEEYSYHPAGAVTAKRLQLSRLFYDPNSGQEYDPVYANLDVSYTYDQNGNVSTVTYPGPAATVLSTTPPSPTTLTYGYDAMGRPASLTDNLAPYTMTGANVNWVRNATYDTAGRLSSWQHYNSTVPGPGGNYVDLSMQETRQYDSNGQMSSMSWAGNSIYTQNTYTTFGGVQYSASYSNPACPSQNNGQVTQVSDTLSGETISYCYDALKRLTSASSTPMNGSSPTAWSQSYQYDGFGNLTQQSLKIGSGNPVATPIAVDANTNRLSCSGCYDLNGNMTSGAGGTMAYDEANRLSSFTANSSGTEYYGYAADNKRIYRLAADGLTEQWTFYGARGERLGVFSISSDITNVTYQGYQPTFWLSFAAVRSSVWFAGKMIWEGSVAFTDRLGSNRATGARFYPYGAEITATANDRTKFATYNRDSFSGLDYADQRFYANSLGRFNTADQYQASGGPNSPASWNRYTYVTGDPVNFLDPTGRDECNPDEPDSCGGYCDENPYAPGCDPGGGPPDPTPPAAPQCNAPAVITEITTALGAGATGACVFGEAGVAYQWEASLAEWNGFAAGSSILPQLAGTAGLGGTITLGGEAITWEIVLAGLAAPEVVITVGAVAGAVALYYAWQQSRQLINVIVNCSVHKNGTPNHESAGVVIGKGSGTTFQLARLNAISDATANLISTFGVGYHLQHCNNGVPIP